VSLQIALQQKSEVAFRAGKFFLLCIFVHLFAVSLELKFGQKEFSTSIAQKFSAIVFQFGRFGLEMVPQAESVSPRFTLKRQMFSS
jgi:hypothetical protein